MENALKNDFEKLRSDMGGTTESVAQLKQQIGGLQEKIAVLEARSAEVIALEDVPPHGFVFLGFGISLLSLIGLVLVVFLLLIRPKKGLPPQLKDYVAYAKNAGHNSTKIREDLLKQGWAQKDIDAVLKK